VDDIPELSPQTYERVQAVPLEPVPAPPEPRPRFSRQWHWIQFGGSPIPLCFDATAGFSHTRLYLGPSTAELGYAERPDIDGIINLCELDDPWIETLDDRRWPRGEGIDGYSWQQLYRDMAGVLALLRAGRRVLIHCMAGVNRSPTLATAVLMGFEGIDAATALARVQRFHPRAHPEDRHWRALRQIEIILRDQHDA
jgi:protein-tyrosine phosphatase